MVAVGVTLRMHGERLDQSSRLDWLFHCCKVARQDRGRVPAEDRRTRRECFTRSRVVISPINRSGYLNQISRKSSSARERLSSASAIEVAV
jgi:hypothetical protein